MLNTKKKYENLFQSTFSLNFVGLVFMGLENCCFVPLKMMLKLKCSEQCGDNWRVVLSPARTVSVSIFFILSNGLFLYKICWEDDLMNFLFTLYFVFFYNFSSFILHIALNFIGFSLDWLCEKVKWTNKKWKKTNTFIKWISIYSENVCVVFFFFFGLVWIWKFALINYSILQMTLSCVSVSGKEKKKRTENGLDQSETNTIYRHLKLYFILLIFFLLLDFVFLFCLFAFKAKRKKESKNEHGNVKTNSGACEWWKWMIHLHKKHELTILFYQSNQTDCECE